jgi:hypothetical protein
VQHGNVYQLPGSDKIYIVSRISTRITRPLASFLLHELPVPASVSTAGLARIISQRSSNTQWQSLPGCFTPSTLFLWSHGSIYDVRRCTGVPPGPTLMRPPVLLRRKPLYCEVCLIAYGMACKTSFIQSACVCQPCSVLVSLTDKVSVFVQCSLPTAMVVAFYAVYLHPHIGTFRGLGHSSIQTCLLHMVLLHACIVPMITGHGLRTTSKLEVRIVLRFERRRALGGHHPELQTSPTMDNP